MAKCAVGKTFIGFGWMPPFVEAEQGNFGLAMTHIAAAICRWDSRTLVLALADLGEDVNRLSSDGVNRAQKTPLHIAAERLRVQSVVALLMRGAVVNKKSEQGFTGYSIAWDIMRGPTPWDPVQEEIFTKIRRAKLCQEFQWLALCANRRFGGKESRTCPRVVLNAIAMLLCEDRFEDVISI